MTDAERLDAISQYGLCIAAQDSLWNGQWQQNWICAYNIGTEQRVITALNIRDVIDAAVLDIQTSNVIEH